MASEAGTVCPGNTHGKRAQDRKFWAVAVLAACLALAVATAARADDDAATLTPLALAFAVARSSEAVSSAYQYQLDYKSMVVSLVANIDPTAAAGARLNVLSSSVSEDAKPDRLEAVIADIDRNAAEEFWCSNMLKAVPADAERVRESGELTIYQFEPQPTGGPNDGFTSNLVGEIGIERTSGAVVNFKLSAPKPFRQAVIAKIKTFKLSTECKPAPNGRFYARDFRMELSGSAAFRDFQDEVVRQVSVVEAASQL